MSWDAEGRYYAERQPSISQPLLSESEYGEKLSRDANFRGVTQEGRKFRDLLCALLFFITFAAMSFVAFLGFLKGDPSKLVPSSDWSGTVEEKAEYWLQDAVAHMKKDVDVIGGSLGFAFLLAIIWTYLLRAFTKLFIYATLVLGVLFVIVCGGLSFYLGFNKHSDSLKVFGACLLGIALVLTVLAIFFKKKIALTAALMTECCKGVQHNPAIFIVITIISALLLAFVAAWVASFIYLFSIPGENIDVKVPHTAPTFNTKIRYLLLFNIFGFYWTVALLLAIFQATVAGAIATWYFSRDIHGFTGKGSPALKSFGWAITKSFGSLAFGSLILAIMQFINYVINKSKKLSAQNRVLACLFCCIKCTTACLEKFVQFIDKWAYIYIAMHGESFISSARNSFNLIQRNIISAAVVDSLGHLVLFIGRIFGSACCTLAAVGVLIELGREISGVTVAMVAIFSFVIFSLFSYIIGIGVDTVFICYLEDLERNGEKNLYIDPKLHSILQQKSIELSPRSYVN